MLAVWVANGAVLAVIGGVVYLTRLNGVDFAAGLLLGTVIYQVCHRIIYGRWL